MTRLQITIKQAQLVFPQLRLGQLLINAVSFDKPDMSSITSPGTQLFYMSDEDLIEALEAYMFEHGGDS